MVRQNYTIKKTPNYHIPYSYLGGAIGLAIGLLTIPSMFMAFAGTVGIVPVIGLIVLVTAYKMGYYSLAAGSIANLFISENKEQRTIAQAALIGLIIALPITAIALPFIVPVLGIALTALIGIAAELLIITAALSVGAIVIHRHHKKMEKAGIADLDYSAPITMFAPAAVQTPTLAPENLAISSLANYPSNYEGYIAYAISPNRVYYIPNTLSLNDVARSYPEVYAHIQAQQQVAANQNPPYTSADSKAARLSQRLDQAVQSCKESGADVKVTLFPTPNSSEKDQGLIDRRAARRSSSDLQKSEENPSLVSSNASNKSSVIVKSASTPYTTENTLKSAMQALTEGRIQEQSSNVISK